MMSELDLTGHIAQLVERTGKRLALLFEYGAQIVSNIIIAAGVLEQLRACHHFRHPQTVAMTLMPRSLPAHAISSTVRDEPGHDYDEVCSGFGHQLGLHRSPSIVFRSATIGVFGSTQRSHAVHCRNNEESPRLQPVADADGHVGGFEGCGDTSEVKRNLDDGRKG